MTTKEDKYKVLFTGENLRKFLLFSQNEKQRATAENALIFGQVQMFDKGEN